MKFVRDDDTPFTGTFRFDGYAFGDRLLEGVFFHGDATNGVVDFDTIRIAPDAADYFADLNQKKWLAAARKYVNSTDVLETLDGKEEIWVEDDSPALVCGNPQPISIMTGADFLDSVKKK